METPQGKKWAQEERARYLRRKEATYTGICPGCGDQRPDLCSLDNPVLCGDCGLEAMMTGMGAVVLKKEKPS